MKLPGPLFELKLKKKQKKHPQKIPYISGNETFCSNTKKILIFCYISGNGSRKKVIHISGNRNPKKLFMFWKMEPLSPSSKK